MPETTDFHQQGPYGQLPPQFAAPAGYPGTYAPPSQNPGQAMGIAALIAALLVWPVGLVLSIVSFSQSRKARLAPTGLAIAGLVLSSLAALFWIVVLVLVLLAPDDTRGDGSVPSTQASDSRTEIAEPLQEPTPAEMVEEPAPSVAGVTYTCDDLVFETVPAEPSNPLYPSLLQVYNAHPVTDNTAAFLSGALPIPEGQTEVLVLECAGDGMFDDGSNTLVTLQLTVDLNGDSWYAWEAAS
ncbi:DUF4190 domain-containing protein [Cellulosimicrobium cellulans]